MTRRIETKEMAGDDGITTVEDLVLLRTTAENWAETAARTVLGFKRSDGSFWKDSKAACPENETEAPHITTSARAYTALLYSDRLRDTSKGAKVPEWAADFKRFLERGTVGRSGGRFFEALKPRGEGDKIDPYEVNTFDIAHLTEFFQVSDYLKRFHALDTDPTKFFNKATDPKFDEKDVGDDAPALLNKVECDTMSARDLIVRRLLDAIAQAAEHRSVGVGFPGEVRFEEGRPDSRHYFATLHTLRALHALGVTQIKELTAVVAGARSFAIEQAYYFQRGATHRQDPVRLAFAGCIYAIYDEHVDKDLCLAIVESLAAAQQENGSWPATHPVFRKNNAPWHIASHEVALCLGWLYFQPRVPDAARPLIVRMMQRYFLNGVIPTFYKASTSIVDDSAPLGSKKDGWQDDHTVSPDTTLGWASAIVCHFLSGFVHVLNDWINRRVVEELGLQLATERYLIDDTASSPSPRWARTKKEPFVWPDLPPHGWLAELQADGVSKGIIEKNWTDPTMDASICAAIADKVLNPILRNPSEQPQRDRCAGLMPGDPGTRKTSLVKQISELVRWPMVAVPASSIFAEGFDRMEARANRVFGLLNHLRGCVIFFDEFEEFFLSRGEDDAGSAAGAPAETAGAPTGTVKPKAVPSTGSAETNSNGGETYKSRTIAAFTTSAMLPRLQELHDKDRCLIFLATNYPAKLDSAIKRPGRFDFTITVNHPEVARLVQYFGTLNAKSRRMTGLDAEDDTVVEVLLTAARSAIEEIARQDQLKQIKFSIIEEALRSIRPKEEQTPEQLKERMKASIRGQIKDSRGGNPPELTNI